jgi:hypothetical protein
MATSSILGGDHAPARPRGTGVDALGPSDTSDSGSDVLGDRNHAALPDEGAEGAFPLAHDSDTDAAGTGERASADATAPRVDADILPDRVGIDPSDALDASVSIEDPGAALADELAVPTDEDEDETNEDGADDALTGVRGA